MATLVQYKDGVAGIRLQIDKPRFRIGRGPDNEISIDDELVSIVHAVIEIIQNDTENVEYYLQDQQSTNGTFVNDKKISLYKLANEDVIRIGLNNFKFIDDHSQDMEETAQLHNTWIPGVYYTGKKKKKKKKTQTKKK
ncbi:MAG: FHA domain-containing protein [Gammaproteobacteria bacterium]|nr:FHA domain-containing protein [Gammaproteobacteria bacterium]MDH5777708.1 FHA domain-containing protein [Gammaproteobacteria bacterium]